MYNFRSYKSHNIFISLIVRVIPEPLLDVNFLLSSFIPLLK